MEPMNENQFFNDLKTSLEPSIDYVEAPSTPIQTKIVGFKESDIISAQDIKDIGL